MPITFYNALTHRHDTFTPLEPGKVAMYSCGPTVYDFAHIGNFRSFLFADLLRRFLELAGHDVHHVMNITDVGHMTDDSNADGAGEDKMQAAAKRIKEDKKSGKVPDGAISNPDDPYQIAAYFTKAFLDDARALGMKVAFESDTNIHPATQAIPQMQEMIRTLIERGHAYVAGDGVVYYSVESFPDYGKLSGNTLQQLRGGAGGRVSDTNQASKRHPADFMLWKPDASHIMKWDSPWGAGYPGWHIECSALARTHLKRDVIDIHTGGEDLIFPHHECEIAQSCGCTGQSRFANFWMHARFLLVDGEKMSKSKGNFYTARDVFEGKVTGREVHPAVLRYELIKTHYRSNMNFTAQGLKDSANAVQRFQRVYEAAIRAASGKPAEIDNSHPVVKAFLDALADDLNISGALGAMFTWFNDNPAADAETMAVCEKLNSVLRISPEYVFGSMVMESHLTASAKLTVIRQDTDSQIQTWCKQIDEARGKKDYATADALRKQITDAGYTVKNTPQGTVAEKQLA